MSAADCIACFSAASTQIRNCSVANGARVVYDGCFLRAVDSGCFMRYSGKHLFADNQTINLLPFLKTESSPSSKIGAIIGGAALVLLIVGFFVWFKLSKKRRAARRGNIFDATELRGATNYSYKDLKLATKKFKEAKKLGGGGFGDVYKGTLKNGKVVAVKKLALVHSNRSKQILQVKSHL
uniref:Protein kinase domain-containing protein n=1 Tax=Salix viminalis TaxID=40686 RepID=A0A6N2NJW7_SALVM